MRHSTRKRRWSSLCWSRGLNCANLPGQSRIISTLDVGLWRSLPHLCCGPLTIAVSLEKSQTRSGAKRTALSLSLSLSLHHLYISIYVSSLGSRFAVPCASSLITRCLCICFSASFWAQTRLWNEQVFYSILFICASCFVCT